MRSRVGLLVMLPWTRNSTPSLLPTCSESIVSLATSAAECWSITKNSRNRASPAVISSANPSHKGAKPTSLPGLAKGKTARDGRVWTGWTLRGDWPVRISR